MRRIPLAILSAACLALTACEPQGAPAGCLPARPRPRRSPPRGVPIKVGAILGHHRARLLPRAPEQKTLEMLAEKLNASGGLLGRKVQLIIKDSKGAAEQAKSLANQLIEEEKVLAILGPRRARDDADQGCLQAAKTILISCAAAEAIVNPWRRTSSSLPRRTATRRSASCRR